MIENIKNHIRRNILLYMIIGAGAFLLACLLHDTVHHYGAPQTHDMVRVSEDNDYFTIWHDDKRGITCWERYRHLSCIKD